MNTTSIVGWVPEPQGRGTIGLIWSCLVTIFLCTWNVVHPNLPAETDKAWKTLWRRSRYLMVVLVVPEWFCVVAAQDFLNARAVQRESPGWTLAKCHYLLMGGFAVKANGRVIHLSPKKLMKLFHADVLPWPDTTEAEILDRSKADWVLKSLALVQAIWFALQVAGRAAQQLSTTTLELFTLGIISCSFVTYAAWWAKPFDVRKPTVLESKKPLLETREPVSRLGFRYDLEMLNSELPFILGVGGALTLGALHLVGWQFHFPTETERWLWRGSSIACVAIPLMVYAFDRIFGERADWPGYILAGLYILCRLYMMVEMFAGLRAVPADVYKVPQWSQYIPSIG
ncbi:uncharacterized protein EKO05_0003131 [Ascochyta rabiei]|uniref:Uncharacterized protein n=1 Tax=Didymella rabiei TaxID=5454 RepID=A0A163BLR0_DIDRA|nr:uncharacterized protein EKO05_0003131 [Ascochyta rabiei]KZM21840.1 hypothetical protein ST47_g7017 [Ascochyta rabiei]UPX12588.1 hypothetical protein EKO05_0003131 [Ascochyta rabiei]